MRKFAVPPAAAESLVYEVFLVFSGLDSPPRDARAWLIAAACISAKTYLQRRGLPSADHAPDETREFAELLFQRDALQTLPALARDALHLRFAERKTYPEIGAELGLSPYVAERIVAKAFARLRRLRREPHDE